jgi:hypothetical protein
MCVLWSLDVTLGLFEYHNIEINFDCTSSGDTTLLPTLVYKTDRYLAKGSTYAPNLVYAKKKKKKAEMQSTCYYNSVGHARLESSGNTNRGFIDVMNEG